MASWTTWLLSCLWSKDDDSTLKLCCHGIVNTVSISLFFNLSQLLVAHKLAQFLCIFYKVLFLCLEIGVWPICWKDSPLFLLLVKIVMRVFNSFREIGRAHV